MSTKKFKLLFFIGRFQPFHIGHYEVLIQALSMADTVLVLIGSAGKPRSIKNPWTYDERENMVRSSFHGIPPS